jgi:competence transcription factor ComK
MGKLEKEIEFIKERIKELEEYKKRGTTRLSFPNGKSFSVDVALTTFKNILI